MKLAAASATDQGLVRHEQRGRLPHRRPARRSSPSPTAWAATAAARSRAAPRSRRSAPRSRTAPRCTTRSAAPTSRCSSRAAGDDELAGMGTTMTAVIAVGGRQLLIGHVGDSRAYLLHDGALRRATDDHSLVEELVREGRLTPEQAESHPQRAIVDARARRRRAASTSTCTRSTSTPATASCSAPTGSPRWCASATSNGWRGPKPDPQRLADALVARGQRRRRRGQHHRRRDRRARGRPADGARSHAPARRARSRAASRSAVVAPPDPAGAAGAASAPRPKGSRRRAVRGVDPRPVAAAPHHRRRGRRARLVRPQLVLRRRRGRRGRDLQGRPRRRARLEPDRRPAHRPARSTTCPRSTATA